MSAKNKNGKKNVADNAAYEDETTQILGMPEPQKAPKADKTKIEPTPAPIGSPEEFDPVPQEPEGNGKSSMKWMIWVCVIAIVAIIIWWCLPKVEEPVKAEEEEQTEMVADSTAAETAETAECTDSPAPNAATQTAATEAAKTEATPAPAPATKPEVKPETTATPAQTATTSAPRKAFKPKNALDRQAAEVIEGKYGYKPDRQKSFGKGYKKIQRRVNELKRQGAF